MSEHRALVADQYFILLASVARTAMDLGIPWMVTGAGGRILLLEEVYGLPAGRATGDLDFGVMVESWDQYRSLEAAILGDPNFASDPQQRQRLRHADGGYLDLIPFGGWRPRRARSAGLRTATSNSM